MSVSSLYGRVSTGIGANTIICPPKMIQLLEKQSDSHTLKILGVECSYLDGSLYLKGSLYALKPFVAQGRIYWKVKGKQVSKIAIEKVVGVHVVEVKVKRKESILDYFPSYF